MQGITVKMIKSAWLCLTGKHSPVVVEALYLQFCMQLEKQYNMHDFL